METDSMHHTQPGRSSGLTGPYQSGFPQPDPLCPAPREMNPSSGLGRRVGVSLAVAVAVGGLASCSSHRTSSGHPATRSSPATQTTSQPRAGVATAGAPVGSRPQQTAAAAVSQVLGGSQLPSPPRPPSSHPQPRPGQKAPTALLHRGASK